MKVPIGWGQIYCEKWILHRIRWIFEYRVPYRKNLTKNQNLAGQVAEFEIRMRHEVILRMRPKFLVKIIVTLVFFEFLSAGVPDRKSCFNNQNSVGHVAESEIRIRHEVTLRMKLKFVVESKYYVGICDILSGGTGPRGFFQKSEWQDRTPN